MTPERIGIVGLGLIGGTLAKTVHRIHPGIEIFACDTDAASISLAIEEGVITRGFDSLHAAFSQCRYIFLCAPVIENAEFLETLAPMLNENCILTDTGSVKAQIHKEIAALGLSQFFIGGHPMAGSEKSGYENATPYLFENAYYIITHSSDIPAGCVEEYRDFIDSLGCIPLIMTPTEHDHATAAVSHLPHILAAGLVNLVRQSDSQKEHMKSIAAGGFKDITRIASSSPVMWQEICEANKEQILLLLEQFLSSMEQLKSKVASGTPEELRDFFQQAKDYRDSLPIQTSGSLPRIFEVYCDLIDEAGGIATIATILATNGISIKNIGIIHNREFEEGVLRIEFYEEAAFKQAVLLLKKHHYTIYER